MTDIGLAIAAFICTALADAVWVRWQAAVAGERAHAAAIWSVAIILCGSLLTASIADRNAVAYVAALAGAYCGTWWAVRKRKP